MSDQPHDTAPTPPERPESRVRFPEELPISARVLDIARAIDANPVTIVAGETGSGKTTQLPKICLAMGRGVQGVIGCTQPRRIAATSVAARVAKELDTELGEEVGFKIRFAEKIKPTTYVKFMTDGILLAEIQSDPLLRAYDTIILDEVHERSLNIDFLLGYLKQLLPRRPDLRVIISSATLEIERFAAFFAGAPVVQVSGRTYPVEVFYRPPESSEFELAEVVANAVGEITELDPHGDILVFLPGERDIHEALDALEARGFRHTVILPLYARLSAGDQARIFQSLPQRRIVLSTNVAETSLTIPGIIYVVDSGLARMNRYAPRSGITQLPIEPVSKASADQRKGRAGRTQHGVCFRLYSEEDYKLRADYTDAEIKRTGLAGVILRMKTLGLGAIEEFPFLDPPHKRAVDEGYRVLEELGAIDDARGLTDIGRKLARFPLDPRLARMILGGEEHGALDAVLVIASALSVQDPRERPAAAQRAADDAHRKFRDENSDFTTLLRIFAAYAEARAKFTHHQLRKFCRDQFLSFLRMREWAEVHQQLVGIVRELALEKAGAPAAEDALHRALLPGLLSRIGMYHPEHRVYLGARQTRFLLHPASGLSKKPPAWVMAAELVETTQLYARFAARIDPAWLEAAGAGLCKHSYGDPHWERKPAQVVASEQVTLFGLPIVKQRRVNYGLIDPVVARTLFIRHALAEREYDTRAPFMKHNDELIAEAKRLRDKARRSDMVVDSDALSLFFERILPNDVFSGKTFEEWRRGAEAADPHVLELSLDDVLLDEAHDLTAERYPDELRLYGAVLPLSYRFDPSEDDDGITVSLPLALLPQADPEVFEWMIPGWHAEKIGALLSELAKPYRKPLGSLPAATSALAAALRPFDGPILPALEEAIEALFAVRVPRNAWNVEGVAPHLRFVFRVVDEEGRAMATSRDLLDLKRRFAQRARDAWENAETQNFERDGLTAWTFGTLPESIEIRVAGRNLRAYPSLVDQERAVGLRLGESPASARDATRAGLRRLFLLQMGTTPSKLELALPTASLERRSLRQGDIRRQLVARALDDAFELADEAGFPRTREAFERRLALGRSRLPALLASLGQLATEIGAELAKVEASLQTPAMKSPGRKAVVDDVGSQLAHLLPPDLYARYSSERLRQVPRYLRAIQVRLQRLPNDPTKDQSKAAQIQPFWREFQEQRARLADRGRSDDEIASFGWLVEEFRVSIFAPEIKAAVPVSAIILKERWQLLAR